MGEDISTKDNAIIDSLMFGHIDSRRTLHRIQGNDDTLTKLCLGYAYGDSDDIGTVWCWDIRDYQRLGNAISNNNHLLQIEVHEEVVHEDETIASSDFFDGLIHNSSIQELRMVCGNDDIVHGLGQQILKVYREKNNQLKHLKLWDCNLRNAGREHAITKTLKCCNNLQTIRLIFCHITDDQLVTMLKAIGNHNTVEQLSFYGNSIGNAGCKAIATTLLEDPNSNICSLDLRENNIGNMGATAIANGLVNNTKLQSLYLKFDEGDNPMNNAQEAFFHVLCNTSSISSIYSSNHTLNLLELDIDVRLSNLLELNKNTNKQHVAIIKILQQNHSNIDMEPLFGWKTGGEWSLRALPYVINWCERAKTAARETNKRFCEVRVGKEKLSAIYQFAKAMPLLLFVPSKHINGSGKACRRRKRKRTRV